MFPCPCPRSFSTSLVRGILRRCYASGARKTNDEHRVVVTGNSSTIVCWHPQTEFPYECSKPLPAEDPAADVSALKAPYTDALDASLKGVDRYKKMFVRKSDKQVREELMKLTQTNKHIWFPNNKHLYQKKPAPKDREYL